MITRRRKSVGIVDPNAKRSCCLFASRMPWLASLLAAHHTKSRKKRKEKTTPFDVNLMRSQVLFRAAQDTESTG